MKLSVSNLAWDADDNQTVYTKMREMGFCGLEIAPTKIIPGNPYDNLTEAGKWAAGLKKEYGLSVPSMQSIWYGRSEMLFGSDEERNTLLEYTKKAIDFAAAVNCGNLVFGCPRNRFVPEGKDAALAIPFFTELGAYAAEKGTVLSLEANPTIYNTNYMNDTASAVAMVKEIGSDGFKLNLDVGTIIQNDEKFAEIDGIGSVINHVHVSEPRLAAIKERGLHKELAAYLKSIGYDKYVSIEVGLQEDLNSLYKMMEYVSECFG